MKDKATTNLIIVRERGDVIDFDERRKSMKATIRRDIEWAKKTPEVNETIDVITKLIYNLHLIEDGLKGQFNIVVMCEEDHKSHIDCSDVDMIQRAPIILQ